VIYLQQIWDRRAALMSRMKISKRQRESQNVMVAMNRGGRWHHEEA
jgi:hypothetical protein